MNWLDAVLAVLLAGSMVFGFRKGFTREAIGLVSVVAGLLLAIWLYGTAAAYLVRYISSRPAASLAGFLLVFCGTILLGAIVTAIARKFLKVTGLSFFDRLLGAGFGFLRGALIAVALVMGVMAFSSADGPPPGVVDSRLAPYAIDGARVAVAVAPFELKQRFRNMYEQVKRGWDSALEHGKRNGTEEKGANEKSN